MEPKVVPEYLQIVQGHFPHLAHSYLSAKHEEIVVVLIAPMPVLAPLRDQRAYLRQLLRTQGIGDDAKAMRHGVSCRS